MKQLFLYGVHVVDLESYPESKRPGANLGKVFPKYPDGSFYAKGARQHAQGRKLDSRPWFSLVQYFGQSSADLLPVVGIVRISSEGNLRVDVVV